MSFNFSSTSAAKPSSTTCVTCHYHTCLASLTLGSIAAIAGVAIAFSNSYLPPKFVAQIPNPWVYRSVGMITTTLGITAITGGTYGIFHPKVAISIPKSSEHLQITYNREEEAYYLVQGLLRTRLVEDRNGNYSIKGKRYAQELPGPPEEEL